MSLRHSYLLTDIPESLRIALSEAAAESDRSLQDTILGALYGHYGIENPKRRGRRYVSWMDRGSSRMLIRANPELFGRVKEEASLSDRTMKGVILDILSAHYVLGS